MVRSKTSARTSSAIGTLKRDFLLKCHCATLVADDDTIRTSTSLTITTYDFHNMSILTDESLFEVIWIGCSAKRLCRSENAGTMTTLTGISPGPMNEDLFLGIEMWQV